MSARINEERGHVQHGCIEFTFNTGSTVLWPDPDMLALDDDQGKVSAPLMDFFSLWFQMSLSPEMLVCPSVFAIELRDLTNKTTKIHALQEFSKEYFGLCPRNWTTLIVPVCDFEHWSLAVLSDKGFLKFDSGFLWNPNFHGPQKFHEALAKVWCIGMGHMQGSTSWRKACDIKSWVHMKCPQQSDTFSCGYYVMSYMMMYTNHVKHMELPGLFSDVSAEYLS